MDQDLLCAGWHYEPAGKKLYQASVLDKMAIWLLVCQVTRCEGQFIPSFICTVFDDSCNGELNLSQWV